MSGFWKRDDESESDSEVSVSEEEEDDEDNHSFLLSSSSDDDDQQERRVRSEKEKRWEEMRRRADEIKNRININDWNGIQSGFDELVRAVEKASNLISKVGVPLFFIRTLVRLEDALASALEDKEAKKKMSTSNAKSLNIMKQKVRRHNKDYEEKIKAFRENPVQTDDEEEDEEPTKEESESEGEEAPRPAARIDVQQHTDVEWTRPMVKSKLVELVGNRGKKATDHLYQVKELSDLVDLAPDVRSKLEVLMVLIAAQFDTRNLSTDVPVEHWRNAQSNLMDVISIIESHPHIKVHERDDYGVDSRIDDDDDKEDIPDEVRLRGSLLAFCERLDDEFIKSLQNMDPHTKQYVNRLKDENLFLLLAVRLEAFYLNRKNLFAVRRIALRRIEHLYNKREVLNPFKLLVNSYRTRTLKEKGDDDEFDEVETETQAAQERKGPSDLEDDRTLLGGRGVEELDLTITQALHRLAVLLYQSSDERAKTRAMLCEVFNLALEEKYFEARDLFLISHLQDGIVHTDISTQILYNRTLVQLGITAFRFGLIAEAHSCLAELHSTGRVKELLAQGVATSRYAEKQNPELEKQARMRQIPYHMHINPELLDSVHLISAMLLEIPNHAMNPYDTKRKPISKYFRRLMDVHSRQMFNGPPENTHDYIMVASNALAKGDVDRCCDLLVNLKVWKLLPNPEPVKEMLCKCIREEGLRTYLFSFSRLYKSISAQQLSDMFKIPISSVSSIISKMIVNEELHASWDQPSGCVVMHNVEPSRLQTMSLQLADKVAALVENNEKMLESRTGLGFDHKNRDSKYRSHRQWHKGDRSERGDRGERRHDRTAGQYDRSQYEAAAY